MRPSNKSRSRNKSGGNGHNQRRPVGNIVNRVFDSAGPDGKVRGTPQQIIDKYNVLARDAQLSGDRVTAESYLQHAEHYSRMLGEAQRQQQEQRQQHEQQREENQQRPQQRRDDQDSPDHEAGRHDTGGSGLTMFDPVDTDDSGPVDTPESRAQAPLPAPQPTAEPAEAAPQGDGTAPADEAGPAPKRSRSRRKPRPEKAPDEAAAPAE
jgi:hypothetical protein